MPRPVFGRMLVAFPVAGSERRSARRLERNCVLADPAGASLLQAVTLEAQLPF
jgi:hypothetical protein